MTTTAVPIHEEAIESVLTQTYSDVEFLMVEEGTTHHTENAGREFSERVRCFKKDNRGSGAARNSGTTRSTGEYIAFLDPDDLSSPEKLDEQIPLIKHNAKLRLVHSNWAVASENGAAEQSYLRNAPSTRGYVFETLRWGLTLARGVVARRAFLSYVGGLDKSFMIAQDYEDYDLLLQRSYWWKIVLARNPLVTWRPRVFSLDRQEAA